MRHCLTVASPTPQAVLQPPPATGEDLEAGSCPAPGDTADWGWGLGLGCGVSPQPGASTWQMETEASWADVGEGPSLSPMFARDFPTHVIAVVAPS